MADREQFLAHVRERIQAGGARPHERYQPTVASDSVWTPSRPRPPVWEPSPDELPERFLAELRALGGTGARVADTAAARDYITELARQKGVALLVRWGDEPTNALGVDAPLADAGTRVAVWGRDADARALCASAEIGLSSAEYAVAETGSLVLVTSPERGRAVTLLPPAYVAVVSVPRLVPRITDVIAHYAQAGPLPASLCFHTGPSRSADIEQSLAIGVHAPGEIHVLLVG
jgi:L-lactate dehydrogenase complex protein LldG